MHRTATALLVVLSLPFAALGAVGIFGCATTKEPVRTSAQLSSSRETFLRCVASQAAERGFSIKSSDVQLGTLHAERWVAGTSTLMEHTDQLDASMPEKTATLSVYTDQKVIQLNGQTRFNRDVSEAAAADAEEIKSACFGEQTQVEAGPSSSSADDR